MPGAQQAAFPPHSPTLAHHLPPQPTPARPPQGSLAGNAASTAAYKAGVQVAQVTLAAAKYLTNSSAHLPAARTSALSAVAGQVDSLLDSVSATAGRRLLQTPALLGGLLG